MRDGTGVAMRIGQEEKWDRSSHEGWNRSSHEGWGRSSYEGWDRSSCEGWDRSSHEGWDRSSHEGWERSSHEEWNRSTYIQGGTLCLILLDPSRRNWCHKSQLTSLVAISLQKPYAKTKVDDLYFYAEVGKVTLKINGDEALSDESV